MAVAVAQASVPLYGVHEVVFEGPFYHGRDEPAVEVDFYTDWEHESGSPVYRIHGFWDGDGAGVAGGHIFKVRFCPTRAGKWTLLKSGSNKSELKGRNEEYSIICRPSSHKGFWEVDQASPGKRWYKRSKNGHEYIFGNTHYSFLSGYTDIGPSGGDISSDVTLNAAYFRKLRFALAGDRYPHPTAKPFFDDQGQPTDNGNFSHRPNPEWFHQRVDRAVQRAYELDLIADLILNGPDTEESRSVLTAAHNGGDARPFLKYIAARYGSYPNIWICLANEWDIKLPKYSADQIRTFGRQIREFLPYPTPLSVHPVRDWNAQLNSQPSWNDHVIIQNKLKNLAKAADVMTLNHATGGADKPVINDELAYQGAGDGWTEEDVIEAHLGAFLGGGYATTSYKPANKKGQYFWGNFDAREHSAADNLLWLREKIDSNITFWKMSPVPLAESIFSEGLETFRTMQWDGKEYVLGTNQVASPVSVRLPSGKWVIRRFDIIAKREETLSREASGTRQLEIPASRAALFFFKKRDQ